MGSGFSVPPLLLQLGSMLKSKEAGSAEEEVVFSTLQFRVTHYQIPLYNMTGFYKHLSPFTEKICHLKRISNPSFQKSFDGQNLVLWP